jgi:hypothetical protein
MVFQNQNQDDSDDFVIQDIENYSGQKNKQFNHQELIMISLRKAIEAGSCEMRPGYTNVKTDRKGNEIVAYVEDTRKRFIETVKICKSIIACDFDEEAEDLFNQTQEYLQNKLDEFLYLQINWWNSLSPLQKKDEIKQGHFVSPKYLNKNLPYYDLYIEEQVDVYREVLEEITKLTKRLGFYEMADFTA